MALSAVIVDDEQLALDELSYLLKSVDDVAVVAQGHNGLDAVNLIKEHSPDLVFLDVQMPGLDGFGVIKKLIDRKINLPQIIFATAYDQYALQAFRWQALDYLLKPIEKERLAVTIDRARKLIAEKNKAVPDVATACRSPPAPSRDTHLIPRPYGSGRWHRAGQTITSPAWGFRHRAATQGAASQAWSAAKS